MQQASRAVVRPVGVDDFDAIYPLLLEFKNPRMSRDDWRDMVFAYDWSPNPLRGYALYVDERPVGFMATIFSERTVLGRLEPFCNTACWIVRPEHRAASVSLFKPILALKDHTLVNFTPTQRAYDVFSKLGFKPLESHQLLLLPAGSPAQIARAVRGSFSTRPSEFRGELGPVERKLLDDHAGCRRSAHVLLRSGDKTCYLIATALRRKRVRFAELQYVGDREVFWNNRPLAHAALFRALGALGIALDSRLAAGRSVPLALRLPLRRLYRPRTPDITPVNVDGLYSELMTLTI